MPITRRNDARLIIELCYRVRGLDPTGTEEKVRPDCRVDRQRVERAPPARGRTGRQERHFDTSIAEFSASYADQAERDYESFVNAIRKGRLEALIEDK